MAKEDHCCIDDVEKKQLVCIMCVYVSSNKMGGGREMGLQ